MQFVKMHGLGNDFVIVSYDQVDGLDVPNIASKISNRNTGIGCDQFIVYKASGVSQYQMWIYNRDGSFAGACGNASRCVTKLIYMQNDVKEIELDVLGRKLKSRVISDELFETNMGTISFDSLWMPDYKKIWDVISTHSQHVKKIICADIGNRHLILFVDDSMPENEKHLLGEILEWHELFSEGVNINFAYISEQKIDLKVWERYAGFTHSCGSGACATVAAASRLGLIKDTAEVHFSTGVLDISIKNGEIYMAGPATFVAEGKYDR